MSDPYPSNAHNPQAIGSGKPARERQRAVLTNVTVRKKPLGTRIADRGHMIWRDVLIEVIGPYIRDMFADAFHRGIDETFNPTMANKTGYRSPRPGQPTQHISSTGYVVTDYNSQYTAGASAPAPMSNQGMKPFDFSQYTFGDYAAGRELIDRLRHCIHAYGHATVNDLLDLMSMAGDHTGENYGWEGLDSLANAEVRRIRGGGGFYLDIPDARPLRK
jgi:hypothetical protein